MCFAIPVLLLILASHADAATSDEVDTFFRFSPGTTESLDPSIQSKLKAATDDFEAVVAGRKPHHSVPEKNAPLPADGGSSYWSGPGYRLTIVKSLVSVAGVSGYSYGPILELDSNLADGNASTFSRVGFYPTRRLKQLLSR